MRASRSSIAGASSDGSPRKRLITKPRTCARSSGVSSSIVPTRCANTPPRSMSPTSRTVAPVCSATRMFTMSPARRFVSAGLPAPSAITSSYSARSDARARSTAGQSSAFFVRKSAERSSPAGRPSTMTCEVRSPCGLSSTGFIATVGASPAAAACSDCARPISPPSAVTSALLDMFCALNGTTCQPSCRKMRQSAVTSTDLPTEDAVPSTINTGAVTRATPAAQPGTRATAAAPPPPPAPRCGPTPAARTRCNRAP